VTPTLGVDASFSHQDAGRLNAAGVRAIGRYAPGGGADPGKTITQTELALLLLHHVAVWLVYELTVGRWRGGYAAGKTDGYAARVACRAVGWPDTRPIFTAYDENLGPADHDTFVAYQRGFNDGQSSAGARCAGAAYGDGYVLVQLAALGLIAYQWLSDSTAFYGSRDFARSGQAEIVQWYGRTLPGLSGIDVDDLLVVDFGQYPAPVAPVPQPAPQRSNTMIGFFTIPDHAPAVAPSTVFMHRDGMEYRSMVNMDEVKYWSFIAQLNGVPKAAIDPDKIGTIPWERASRMRLVDVG
jgi:hypothetical protein